MRTEGRMIGNGIRNWCWRKHRRRTTHLRRPQVELLERRELLAILTVTQPFGDGPGSLPNIARNAGAGSTIRFADQITRVTLEAAVDLSGLTLDGGGDVTIATTRDGLTVNGESATVENVTLLGSSKVSFTAMKVTNRATIKDVVFTNFAIGLDVLDGATVDIDGAELTSNSIGMNNEGRVTLDHVSFINNVSGGLLNQQTGNVYATNSSWHANNVGIRNDGGILDVFSSAFTSNTSPSAEAGAAVDSVGGGTVYLIGLEVSGQTGGPVFHTESDEANSVFAVEDSFIGGNQGGILLTEGSEGLTFFADVTMKDNVSDGPQIVHHGKKLLLEYSTFEGNTQSDSGLVVMDGNTGQEQQLEVLYVLFKDNVSMRPTIGGALSVSVGSGSSVNVRNSTFTSNDTHGGEGGAIWVEGGLAGGGEVKVISSTFVGNAAHLGGAIFNQVQRPAKVSLNNNIIQMNAGGNLYGVFAGDYNILDSVTGVVGLTGLHNLIGKAALLAPLSKYDGQVYPPVFALFSDSPVGIDQGDPQLASPLGSRINIGATNFVVQRPPVKPPTGDPVNPPPTRIPTAPPVVMPGVLFVNVTRRSFRLLRAGAQMSPDVLLVSPIERTRNIRRRKRTIVISIAKHPLIVRVRSVNGFTQTPLRVGDILVVICDRAKLGRVHRLANELMFA